MSDQLATPGQDWAQALLRERAGLARRGLHDRVAAVDAELARLGVTPPPAPVEPYRSTTTAPRGRTSRKPQEG